MDHSICSEFLPYSSSLQRAIRPQMLGWPPLGFTASLRLSLLNPEMSKVDKCIHRFFCAPPPLQGLGCSYNNLRCRPHPPLCSNFTIFECGHHLLVERVSEDLWIFEKISRASTDPVVLFQLNKTIMIITSIVVYWNVKFLKNNEWTMPFNREK